MSSRKHLYVDYLSWLAPGAIKRILLIFIIGLIILELFWRGFSPHYTRTAVSSLHGIRTILQELSESKKEKVIGVGDSTLLGGGVFSHNDTFMGHFSTILNQKESKFELFNLSAPGGDTVTSALILDAIKTENIRNIDRVIIEVLPSKFFSYDGKPTSKYQSLNTVIELQNFVPFIRPSYFDLDVPLLSYPQRVEAYAQWWSGDLSMLYRHRDFLRTEVLGNYPIYWLIGKLLPRSLISRVFPEKSKGLNRLAARADDFPFNSEKIKRSSNIDSVNFLEFTPHYQGDYLEQALAIAKSISAKPPIILSFPIHYEFNSPSQVARNNTLKVLNEFNQYLSAVAEDTGSMLMFVDSESFQSPSLWTRTEAHFNAVGHLKIWESLKEKLCQSTIQVKGCM
jgi:hypothetical protein